MFWKKVIKMLKHIKRQVNERKKRIPFNSSPKLIKLFGKQTKRRSFGSKYIDAFTVEFFGQKEDTDSSKWCDEDIVVIDEAVKVLASYLETGRLYFGPSNDMEKEIVQKEKILLYTEVY
uniref:Uncharacterized protein n=1 Tax=Rhabditophanes sp. KR3021 TaxID=114890 RepID=A0AC35TI19_9BILA